MFWGCCGGGVLVLLGWFGGALFQESVFRVEAVWVSEGFFGVFVLEDDEGALFGSSSSLSSLSSLGLAISSNMNCPPTTTSQTNQT